MKIIAFLFLVIFFSLNIIYSQTIPHKSIHQQEHEYYQSLEIEDYSVFDIHKKLYLKTEKSNCTLEKIVFGYYPYWESNSYLNYQWNLLSDLSFFSWNFNPSTEEPTTINNWTIHLIRC